MQIETILSFRRKTVPVWIRRLWQAFRQQQWPEEAHARSHVWQAISVQTVRQVLHSSQLLKKTHEGENSNHLTAIFCSPSHYRAFHSLFRTNRFQMFDVVCRFTTIKFRWSTPLLPEALGTSPPLLPVWFLRVQKRTAPCRQTLSRSTAAATAT